MTRKEYNTAVENHADHLYRFVLKSMNDADAAADVVQDVFTKLWEKRDTVHFEKVKSYLFTAGYRTMIDHIRKNKRITTFDHVTETTYNHTRQYSDLNEVLEEAVQKLPSNQKHALLLRDYEGYNYKEIGEILSLNESQVKISIFRARKALQQYIKHIETLI